MIPTHPNLVMRRAIAPTTIIGVDIPAKKDGAFNSKRLKSLESILMILPNSWDLAIYCEILVIFLKSKPIKVDLKYVVRMVTS